MSVLGKLVGAAMDVVVLPFSAAKDLVTFGGIMTGDDEPATIARLKAIAGKVDDAIEEVSEK